MADLATYEDLAARLDWTLDEDEKRIGESALEDLSDEARFYGRDSWEDPTSAPRMVCKLVLKAAVRYMRNPDGYTTSRAGDETLAWNNDYSGQAGAAHFTDDEIKHLKQMGGKSAGIFSAPITAFHGVKKSNSVGWVPTPNGEPFPLFASETDPY